MRAAQDFDAVQIEGVVQHPRVRSQVDAVNEDADRWIDGRNRAVDTQAANGEVCEAARQADVVEGHIRHGKRQIAQVAQLEGVKLFGVEGRDRYRYVLDLRLPLEGGDNHPFQVRYLCRWGRFFSNGLASVRLHILSNGREGDDTERRNNRQVPGSKPACRPEPGGLIDKAHEPPLSGVIILVGEHFFLVVQRRDSRTGRSTFGAVRPECCHASQTPVK